MHAQSIHSSQLSVCFWTLVKHSVLHFTRIKCQNVKYAEISSDVLNLLQPTDLVSVVLKVRQAVRSLSTHRHAFMPSSHARLLGLAVTEKGLVSLSARWEYVQQLMCERFA